MKILKPGNPPDTTVRFKCNWCGCEFEAKHHEYSVEGILTIKGVVDKAYIDCPTCSTQCSTKIIYNKE